ncbi:LytR family transcriptional attenuator [Haloactinopolyspora alba]|uniref:LytR family transcriptional attenuator n=1 Tax=Haloactinopolyspora alba TaxID=648780 RepID=A0A2P8EBS9_9ACTN|nr:LCP family protein [Haloactinopolyspora alba]PSL06929.1 LytR family transcriptional attenuator [Haloactinopolyspora alba]
MARRNREPDPDEVAAYNEAVREQEEYEETVRRRKRNKRIVIGTLCTLLVLALAAAGVTTWFVGRVSSNIERIPGAFDIPDEQRPPAAGGDAVTFLLGGLDGPDEVDVYEPGAARTDTIMLAHFPDGRDHGYLVSIPRDTYVEVPGHGENKINAAYSLGGPSLFVRTVEQLTDIRVDHLALIDWNGFEQLTDELGGVTLTFDEPTVLADDTTLPPGRHTLDGEQALQYVRERKDLPAGDFDRVKRQQNYLRGLMHELLSAGTFTDFGTMNGLTEAVGQAARVDEDLGAFDMARLGMSMRNLRAEDMTFLTVPTDGTGWAGEQSIVVYDAARADVLWQALKADDMDSYLADNPDLVTGQQVN